MISTSPLSPLPDLLGLSKLFNAFEMMGQLMVTPFAAFLLGRCGENEHPNRGGYTKDGPTKPNCPELRNKPERHLSEG